MSSKKYILGIFDDEHSLLEAIKAVRKEKVKIDNVYSPFAIHGIDEALGMRETRIPVAAFLIGTWAALTALLTMAWMMGISWPMNIGGKPYIPWPSLIPITFEFTVLSTSIGMVVIMFYVSRLKPSPKGHPIDPRITDDKFVIAIDAEETNKQKIESTFKKYGASEVNEKAIDENE